MNAYEFLQELKFRYDNNQDFYPDKNDVDRVVQYLRSGLRTFQAALRLVFKNEGIQTSNDLVDYFSQMPKAKSQEKIRFVLNQINQEVPLIGMLVCLIKIMPTELRKLSSHELQFFVLAYVILGDSNSEMLKTVLEAVAESPEDRNGIKWRKKVAKVCHFSILNSSMQAWMLANWTFCKEHKEKIREYLWKNYPSLKGALVEPIWQLSTDWKFRLFHKRA